MYNLETMGYSMDLWEFLNCNNYEQSMFRNAIYYCDYDLVQQLINDFSSFKDQVLHVAAYLGNVDILKYYILAGADINKKGKEDDNCYTPLQSAVSENQFQVVKFLVQEGANVNTSWEGKCHGNCSVLNIAINNHPHNLDMIEFLLKNGADANQTCDKCYSPLVKAINYHQEKIVELLLQHGAEIDSTCNHFGDRITPLYMAVKQNQFKIVKFCLSKNADVNAVTPCRKQSVLHFGIPFAGPEVLDCLLSAGFDLNIENCSGQSVLDLARRRHYKLTSKIEKHLVKIKAVGLYLTDRNLEAVQGPGFNEFFASCCEEIELMKKCRIAHTRVTFYDLLITNEQIVALRFKCVKEENILNYHKKFPLYSCIIEYRLKRVLIRQDRLQNVDSFFGDVFWNLLPATFVRNISSYLDEQYIEQLNKDL